MTLESPDLSRYAGRWVAFIGHQVVGQGATEADARLAAQLARPKETPHVTFVAPHPPLEFPPLLERVRSAIDDRDRVWLVGGAVRDALMGRVTHDLDFAVDGNALALARRVARVLDGAFYPLDDERDTGRVILEGESAERHVLDFARLRAGDILGDLRGRDFTLNAMAVPVASPDDLLDPTGGEADLRSRTLRAASPSAIADDPVRGLRAIRLAAQLDLRIEPATREQARTQAGALARVSTERVRDEFMRILAGRRPAASIRAMDSLGQLKEVLPELQDAKGVTQSPPHTLDVWNHSIAAVDQLDRLLSVLRAAHDPEAAADLTLGFAAVRLGRHREALEFHILRPVSADRPARALLMLAMLTHDIGKPSTRTVEPSGRIRFFEHELVGAKIAAARASALRLSNSEVERVAATVRAHMRPLLLSETPPASRRAIYRYFRDAGPSGVDAALVSLADTLATYGATLPQDVWQRRVHLVAQLLDAYFDASSGTVSPQALIDGDDLIGEFRLSPGPQIGELLEAVREAQAEGEIRDRAGALDFVRRRLGAG